MAKPTRTQLLFEFDMQAQALENGHHSRQYFLCEPYAPCQKSIDQLEPIRISKLKLDSHHRGSILFVRTLSPGARDAAVQTIVEDASGEADRLAVYNTCPSIKADELLPDEAIFAIKEPYYTASVNGHGVRVDHPSDLVYMNASDPRIPESLRPDQSILNKTAQDWKNEGNAAYKAGRHVVAERAYAECLGVYAADSATIKYDVFRNRAMANLCLRRFDAATADAVAAVIPDNNIDHENGAKLNSKAYYRAATALYELRRFEESDDLFQKVKELDPADEDADKFRQRLQRRLRERDHGDYDFTAMGRSVSKKHNRLDHADYLSRTKKAETEKRGRGLFAAENISIGELVLVEKATSVSFDSDEMATAYTIMNPSTKQNAAGTTATLLFNFVQHLTHHPRIAKSLFDLYAGKYQRNPDLFITENIAAIDAFQALAVLDHNCYGCPTTRSASKAAQRQDSQPSTGLWRHVSYINHACNGNAMRSFIGDMMIIRATKDIAEGEEVLMPYRLPSYDNGTTQEELYKVWGFRCDCDLCIVEASVTSTTRRHRNGLIEKVESLISSNPIATRQMPVKDATISKVEQFCNKIEATYDEQKFSHRPRLGLVAPTLWLCQAYRAKDTPDKLQPRALSLLRNLGYVVNIQGQQVDVSRQFCQLEKRAIDAAIFVASTAQKRGQKEVQSKMESLAREMYVTLHGETHGFDERYNDHKV